MENEKTMNDENFEEGSYSSGEEYEDDFEEEEPEFEDGFSLKPVIGAVIGVTSLIVGATLGIRHFIKKGKNKDILDPEDLENENVVDAEYRECEQSSSQKGKDEKTEADED